MHSTMPPGGLQRRVGHTQAHYTLVQMTAMAPTVPHIQPIIYVMFMWNHFRLFRRQQAAKSN